MKYLVIIFSCIVLISTTKTTQVKETVPTGRYVSSDESFCKPVVTICIERTKKKYFTYHITSNNKNLDYGRLTIKKNDEKETIIIMKNISAIYRNDSIIFQNSGNEINNYLHLENCGGKYLYFLKNK